MHRYKVADLVIEETDSYRMLKKKRQRKGLNYE